MDYGRFSKEPLSEQIIKRIIAMIREEELQPGHKLPPERELASLMEVSRPSLREALRALAGMNVIEIRQGDGTYVTSLEPELLFEHMDFVFSLRDATFLELLEARKVLEVGIAALAAQRITTDEIGRLENLAKDGAHCVSNPDQFLQNDLELHRSIVEVARNGILERVMESISRLGLASRQRTNVIPGVRQQTVRDHQAIVNALKVGDPKAASHAMLDHLTNVERELRSELKEDGSIEK